MNAINSVKGYIDQLPKSNRSDQKGQTEIVCLAIDCLRNSHIDNEGKQQFLRELSERQVLQGSALSIVKKADAALTKLGFFGRKSPIFDDCKTELRKFLLEESMKVIHGFVENEKGGEEFEKLLGNVFQMLPVSHCENISVSEDRLILSLLLKKPINLNVPLFEFSIQVGQQINIAIDKDPLTIKFPNMDQIISWKDPDSGDMIKTAIFDVGETYTRLFCLEGMGEDFITLDMTIEDLNKQLSNHMTMLKNLIGLLG